MLTLKKKIAIFHIFGGKCIFESLIFFYFLLSIYFSPRKYIHIWRKKHIQGTYFTMFTTFLLFLVYVETKYIQSYISLSFTVIKHIFLNKFWTKCCIYCCCMGCLLFRSEMCASSLLCIMSRSESNLRIHRKLLLTLKTATKEQKIWTPRHRTSSEEFKVKHKHVLLWQTCFPFIAQQFFLRKKALLKHYYVCVRNY